ncbi:unnamed protein product [Cuscuta europaea]|uniref:DUF4283 domain-containing protein n=1 Tax=Cuscuta europaea TaxID=41803 RepID=A0A9P0YSV4_CUSEU|nr:unnamed protein product [Cuscuta europaea]
MRKNKREIGENSRTRTTRSSSRFDVLGDIDVEIPVFSAIKPSANMDSPGTGTMVTKPSVHVEPSAAERTAAGASITLQIDSSGTLLKPAQTTLLQAGKNRLSAPSCEPAEGTDARQPSPSRLAALENENFPDLQTALGGKPTTAKEKNSGLVFAQTFVKQPQQGNANATASNTGKAKQPVSARAVQLVPISTVTADAEKKGQTAPQKVPNAITDTSIDTASLEIPPKEKAWSSLFKDNRDPSNGLKLRYIPPKGKSLDFGDRILPSMIEMWGFCLVGYITGKFPGLKAIYDLKNTWGVSCQIKTHAKGWIIFKFQNDGDREKVLNGGPYTIFGMQLLLKSLSEDFSFDDDEFLKVPIWVKFPNLHMKLWNEEAMSEVASMVGVPLSTDKVTQNRSNHHFARVLIEVDVSKPPRLSFHIRLPSRKVVNQMVVYETFPNFCFHCKMYGHHPFICKKLASKERDLAIVDKKEDTVNEGSQVEIVDIAVPAAQPDAQEPPVVAAHPTGCCSDPTGSTGQTLSQGSANANLDASLHTDQGIAETETAAQGTKTTVVPESEEDDDTEDEESDNEPKDEEEQRILDEYWDKITQYKKMKKRMIAEPAQIGLG